MAYDFIKAFDTLSHASLLNCLKALHFPEGFIEWAVNYLSDCINSTRIGETISNCCSVTPGIPQGSVLGPAFYCLAVGDLEKRH